MTASPYSRTATFAKWALLGALLSAVITAGILVFLFRDPAPYVTRENQNQAAQRWLEAEITNYEMEIEAVGAVIDRYHVEIRNGQIVAVVRNGEESSRPRSFRAWTVQGMLDVIARDLEIQESEENDGARSSLSLRAEFDAELGYPRRYLRSDRSSGATIRWQVLEFRRL